MNYYKRHFKFILLCMQKCLSFLKTYVLFDFFKKIPSHVKSCHTMSKNRRCVVQYARKRMHLCDILHIHIYAYYIVVEGYSKILLVFLVLYKLIKFKKD